MKRIISTIATLFTLVFSFNASAKENVNPLKDFNTKKIVLVYVEALTTGNIDYNKHLFTSDFEYRNTANNEVTGRSVYINF